MKRHWRSGGAVSEILSMMYIIIISTTIIGTLLVWAPQQLNEKKDAIRIESIHNQFTTFNNAIDELLNRGVGSTKSVELISDTGYLESSSQGTRMVLYHSITESGSPLSSTDDFSFRVSGLEYDKNDPDDHTFTYIQESLPSSFIKYLNDNDKKIRMTGTDLETGNPLFSNDYLYSEVTVISEAQPLFINFFDNTQIVSSSEATWKWDFDYTNQEQMNENPSVDSTSQNPSMQKYTAWGRYTTLLTVTDRWGQEVQVINDVIIEPSTYGGVVAGFTYFVEEAPLTHGSRHSNIAYTGREVTFESESFIPSSVSPTYTWDFGDDSPLSVGSVNPSHTYSTPGRYQVKLTVTPDNPDDPLLSSVTHYITVLNSPPIAEFSSDATADSKKNVNDVVTFVDTSYDIPDEAKTGWQWSWDFDYTTEEFLGMPPSVDSTLQNPTHVYTSAGTYTVALIVTDSLGAVSDIKTHDIVIGDGITNPDGTLTNPFVGAGFTYMGDTPWGSERLKSSKIMTEGYLGLTPEYILPNDQDPVEPDEGYWSYEDWLTFSHETGGMLRLTIPDALFPQGADVQTKTSVTYKVGWYTDDQGSIQYVSKSHIITIWQREPYADFSYKVVHQSIVDTKDRMGNPVSLRGSVQIDITIPYNTKYVSLGLNYNPSTDLEWVLAGRIFLFDLGYLRYATPQGQTSQAVVFENGAILIEDQQSGFIAKNPKFYDESRAEGIGTELVHIQGTTKDFVIHVVQLKGPQQTTSFMGTPIGLKCTLLASTVVEPSVIYQNRLRIQLFGDTAQIWRDFLINNHGFSVEKYYPENIIYGSSYGSTLMLARSVFQLEFK